MLGRVGQFFRSLAGYSRSFWSANLSELFERIAFYGTASMLVLYLTRVRGFEEGDAFRLNGNFGLAVYALPVLSGFIADYMGYRRAILMAYGLLATGYFLVGQLASYWGIAAALLLVAFGASIIKPSITGTVQKTCTSAQAAVGFSIYYMLVNIGGAAGPNIAGRLADAFDEQKVFYSSTGAIVVAFLLVLVLYAEPKGAGDEAKEKKTLGGFFRDLASVLVNVRLMLLILFVAGFWSMFFQFFTALPTYLTGELEVSSGAVGTVISIGAASIVLLQVVVGYLVRNLATARAVLLGICISSAGVMLIASYPSVWVVGAGIFVFSLGEMTYSAHFYKYLGDLAPKDQVGMYMGFAFLPIALGSFLAGQIAAPIADYARTTLGSPGSMWLLFGSIGVASAVGLALLTFAFPPKETAATRPPDRS